MKETVDDKITSQIEYEPHFLSAYSKNEFHVGSCQKLLQDR